MKKYSFRIEGKKVAIKDNSGLSLYEACKRTIGVNGGIVVCDGKLIAFFCSARGLVRPGFGASIEEKTAVNNFLLGV